jgi:hypothetical protein
MKKTILMAAVVCLMTACEKLSPDDAMAEIENEKAEEVVAGRTFTFTINGDFENEMKTRGILSANGSDMSDLWMFDYVGDNLVQQLHLTTSDENFDAPSITLSYASHHVYIVVSRGTTPTVDAEAHTITWDKVSDTFWKDYTIDVTSSSTKNRSCTLARVVTKLKVTPADEIPAGMASIVVAPSVWYSGIDYKTGNPVGGGAVERAIAVPASYVGTTSQLAASIFSFSSATAWSTDVTVTAKDANGAVLGSVTMAAVPLIRNRATEMSGGMFAEHSPVRLTLDDAWSDAYVGEW